MSDSSPSLPALIADPTGLTSLVHDLARARVVAVDTESNSLFAYRERVCLIQFSTASGDYLVDPLRFSDLSALAPLFANPRQQKVFHAAEYDILCLKRDYGFEFAAIFDTMIAARTLGWPQLGLAAILEGRFGVKMNKKFQRANWGQRPLTPEQLDYARLDTRYLIPLRDILSAELTAAHRMEEAGEEFSRLARLGARSDANGYDPRGFWRINGARELAPRQAAVLKELYAYRDQQAQRADRPPFKIMSDETLLEIARHCPRRAGGLKGLKGMTAGQVKRHAPGLLKAIQRGLAAAHLRPPDPEREAEEVRERYDRLHRWRKQKAKARGVESDVILPREALWELARRIPHTLDELLQVEHLGPWRRETYGAEILRVLGEQNGDEVNR